MTDGPLLVVFPNASLDFSRSRLTLRAQAASGLSIGLVVLVFPTSSNGTLYPCTTVSGLSDILIARLIISSFNHLPCRSLLNMLQWTGIWFTATASISSSLRFPSILVLTSPINLWTAISNEPFGIGSWKGTTLVDGSSGGGSGHLPNPGRRSRAGPGVLYAIRAPPGTAHHTGHGGQVAPRRPTAPAVDPGFGAVSSVLDRFGCP